MIFVTVSADRRPDWPCDGGRHSCSLCEECWRSRGHTLGGQGHTNAWSGDESVHCVQVSRYTVPGTEHSAVCSMWHAMHT